jgi:hypothetical protein
MAGVTSTSDNAPLAPVPAVRRACLWAAVLSALVIFLWTAARVRYSCDGNWTSPFFTGAAQAVPPELAAGLYRVPGAGYDGQYYRFLAHDPFLQRDYARYVDAPRMRFRRILIPAAAWAVALGRPRSIDGAFLALEMLFVALGVYWCARLLARRGLSPWWGLLYLAVPATMASFDRMLTDGPLAALFAGFLLAVEEQRWRRAWLFATLAALTRETGLFLIAALVADRLLARDWRRAAAFTSAAAPAFAWFAYVAMRVAPEAPVRIFAIPVWGILRRFFWLRPYPDPSIQLLLRVTDFLAVLGLALSIVLAARWLWRSPLPCARTTAVALFIALALILGAPGHMSEPFGFARPVSPLLVWVMLEAAARRRWLALAPPLMVSLAVALVFAQPLLDVARGVFGG